MENKRIEQAKDKAKIKEFLNFYCKKLIVNDTNYNEFLECLITFYQMKGYERNTTSNELATYCIASKHLALNSEGSCLILEKIISTFEGILLNRFLSQDSSSSAYNKDVLEIAENYDRQLKSDFRPNFSFE